MMIGANTCYMLSLYVASWSCERGVDEHTALFEVQKLLKYIVAFGVRLCGSFVAP